MASQAEALLELAIEATRRRRRAGSRLTPSTVAVPRRFGTQVEADVVQPVLGVNSAMKCCTGGGAPSTSTAINNLVGWKTFGLAEANPFQRSCAMACLGQRRNVLAERHRRAVRLLTSARRRVGGADANQVIQNPGARAVVQVPLRHVDGP